MRDLTTSVTTELNETYVKPIVLVEMAFDSETLRLWSGYGNLTWNSETWLGSGDMGAISGVKEVENVEAVNVTLTLSAIPSDYIALALTEPYQGRIVKLWLGFMNSENAVIADPVQVFSGRMDVMTIEDSGETSSISVTVESRLVDLLKSRERRYTHEDQQLDYPGDLGLEYIASIQDVEFKWQPS